MYAGDYDAWSPVWWDENAQEDWIEKVNPYVNAPSDRRGVFCCPGISHVRIHHQIYGNYGCNASAMWNKTGNTWWGYQRTRINSPYASKIIAVSETAGADMTDSLYWFRWDAMDYMSWPHMSNGNFLFFDAHVEHTKQFLIYTDKPSGWMWNHRDI